MSVALAPRTGLIGVPSDNGLALPDDLTFEEWRSALLTAERIEASSPWWVADAMAYGEQAFPDSHSQALPTAEEDPTGVRQSRLKQAAWMATKYPPNTRVPSLSYTHHRAAAELDPDERQGLLRYAAEKKLSTRDLIALVKERQATPGAVLAASSEPSCAADMVWTPAVSDLTDDARAALEFKASTAGARDRQSFAAGWLAALHWIEAEDCFARWGDDDGTAVFGPAAAEHREGDK